jgi:hypothetical protein
MSRLCGNARNRRDPVLPPGRGANPSEGEPKRGFVKGCWESDFLIVVMKPAKGAQPESVERRGSRAGSLLEGKMSHTPRWNPIYPKLQRV